MFQGEIIISGKNSLACTNHADLKMNRKFKDDTRKVLVITRLIGMERPFVVSGFFNINDDIEGLFRYQVAGREVVQYFKGIILSLNEGSWELRLTGNLTDDNVEQFLNNIKKWQ